MFMILPIFNSALRAACPGPVLLQQLPPAPPGENPSALKKVKDLILP